MDISSALKLFEKDRTFFLRHRPELHQPLLKIAKQRKPDDWVEGMPLWLVPEKIIKEAIAVGPHGLLFISDAVKKKDWINIAKHEKLEARLVQDGISPRKAHQIAIKRCG